MFVGPIVPPTYTPRSALIHITLVTARAGRRISCTISGLAGYFGGLRVVGWSVANYLCGNGLFFCCMLLSVFMSTLLRGSVGQVGNVLCTTISSTAFKLTPFFSVDLLTVKCSSFRILACH